MIVVTCPNCKIKFPAFVGKENTCPNCGFVIYLEKKVSFSKKNYERMREEYEIRQEVRNYIREHPSKSKEEIFKDLEKIVRRKGFAPEIIEEEFTSAKNIS